MSQTDLHFEEFVYLPALTHQAVIIAWGGFFFEVEKDAGREKWELLDSGKVQKRLGRKEVVGEKSEPYSPQARVELQEVGGDHSLSVHIAGANCAVVTGLKPDTVYEYRVMVTDSDGSERLWAAGPLRDWVIENSEGTMRTGGRYENRFHTFPDSQLPTSPFEFAVIGDFGRGVRKPSKAERCQGEVAEALMKASRHHDIRLVLTTGDNIYAKTFLGIPVSSSGDEDDDWFFTYFQPYRYLLNRIPFLPAVGNHDGNESEESIDRDQIYDNFYMRTQFARLREPAVLPVLIRTGRRIHLSRYVPGRIGQAFLRSARKRCFPPTRLR
jgi:tartrate-resistant acid phosphatase type 5